MAEGATASGQRRHGPWFQLRNSGRQLLHVYVIRFGVALVRFAFYAGLLRRSRTFGAISE